MRSPALFALRLSRGHNRLHVSGLKQLGTTVSGSNDLVTGASAGTSAGANDVDGGRTSIQSPEITLPSGNRTLTFSWYLAHGSNSSSADYFRVKVNGAVMLDVLVTYAPYCR